MTDAQADQSEFLDCSQFYEVVLGIGFFAVVVAQFLMMRYELWLHVEKKLTAEHEQYLEWLQARTEQNGRSSKQGQMNEVEREISQIERKGDNSRLSEPSGEHETVNVSAPSTQLLIAPSDEQKRYLSLQQQVTEIFGEHLPLIFCTLVLGMLTGSTLVFSLAMFFCFVFTSTLFNYMRLYHQLKRKYRNSSFQPYVELLSSFFVLALYVSYFIRSEFFGA